MSETNFNIILASEFLNYMKKMNTRLYVFLNYLIKREVIDGETLPDIIKVGSNRYAVLFVKVKVLEKSSFFAIPYSEKINEAVKEIAGKDFTSLFNCNVYPKEPKYTGTEREIIWEQIKYMSPESIIRSLYDVLVEEKNLIFSYKYDGIRDDKMIYEFPEGFKKPIF